MTSREKAVQLVQQMYLNGSTDSCEVYRENAAKRTALVAVNELIDHCEQVEPWLGYDFWVQVKKEIEKL
jgi:hypothetical protein